MVEITVRDVNDITPTYTTSGTASVRTTSDAAVDPLTSDTATGYSITITDADTNNQFAGNFDLNDPRFAFQDQGNGVWELVLLANQDITEQLLPPSRSPIKCMTATTPQRLPFG